MMIAYTRADGGVSIVVSAPKEAIEEFAGRMTVKEYRRHVHVRSIPADATDVVYLPTNWSPPCDRSFRDAWVMNAGQVSIHMPKARDIWRGKMRAKRALLLPLLDVQFQRAQETGACTAGIVSAKQALRDVTQDPAIEAAQTPEELRAVWPDALSG